MFQSRSRSGGNQIGVGLLNGKWFTLREFIGLVEVLRHDLLGCVVTGRNAGGLFTAGERGRKVIMVARSRLIGVELGRVVGTLGSLR